MASPTVISNETFDSLATSTLRDYDRTLQDQIFEATPVLNIMRERGRVKEISGGRQISVALLTEENSTVMSYDGADILDLTYQDGMTRAFYDWRLYNAATIITDEEKDLNMGDKHKLFDLLDEKMEQTELSLINRISEDIFKSQSGDNLDGFRTLIGDSAGTVGQINESNESWWAPQRKNAVAAIDLVKELKSLYNDATKGVPTSKKKDYIWVATQDVFEFYEEEIEDRAQYVLTEEMKKLGFGLSDTLLLKGRPFMWDDDADGGHGDDRVWLINTSYLYLVQHPNRKFSTGPMRTPIDQHVSVAHTRFMGNLITNHRRALGVADDIAL